MKVNTSERAAGSGWVYPVIIGGFLFYAAVFIFQTSFIVDGERYFCLFDDAMISMRYAKNLASGAGLVWNPGERIEGFTNLLWTVYMSLLHIPDIPRSKVALLVQLTGLCCLLGNVLLVKKTTEILPGSTRWTVVTAVVLTAFYYPLINWSLQGMEVGPLALLVTATMFLCVKTIGTGFITPGGNRTVSRTGHVEPGSNQNHINKWLYVVPAIAVFIRIDMMFFFLTVLGCMVVLDVKNRKRHILTGALILAASLFLQTVFRQLYYGHVLPNTYYLKMEGYPFYLRMIRGLMVFLRFAALSNWALLIPLLLMLRWRNRYTTLLVIPFVVQVLYSIYVGGDAWERWTGCNRFICVAMPCFFIVVALTMTPFLSSIQSMAVSFKPAAMRYRRYLFAALFPLLAATQFNMFHGPRALGKWLLIRPPMYVNNNREGVKAALLLEKHTLPSATVAVVMAGVLPYFCDRYMIDMLGKTDKTVARQKIRTVSDLWVFNKYFFPGHMKWDYRHSIGRLKPDVITDLWRNPDEAKAPLMNYSIKQLDGFFFYFRKSGPDD